MTTPSQSARRRQGEWAGLNRARIVETARNMDPQTLTLQAVAKKLGVDRKAVTHHVKDRERLLELVAIDAFGDQYTSPQVLPDATWQQACRAYATYLKDSLVATGVLASFFRFPEGSDPKSLEFLHPVEQVLDHLERAGFSESDSANGLRMLANLALSFARDKALALEYGEHPQTDELRRSLTNPEMKNYPAVQHLVASDLATYDDAQFDWYLDVTVRGMESLRA